MAMIPVYVPDDIVKELLDKNYSEQYMIDDFAFDVLYKRGYEQMALDVLTDGLTKYVVEKQKNKSSLESKINKMLDAKMSDKEIISRVINYEAVEKANGLAHDINYEVAKIITDYINTNEVPMYNTKKEDSMCHWDRSKSFIKEVTIRLIDLLKYSIGR